MSIYTWNSSDHKLIIHYILGNNKVTLLAQNIRVHRGNDINSDHFLVVAKITQLARRKKQIIDKTTPTAEEIKVHLLQENC